MESSTTTTILNRVKTPKRHPSRSPSTSSGGSRNSLSSARSAASSMTEGELDNFRSMRGKSAGNFLDSAYSMVDDVSDLQDRLVDVKRRKELQKRLVDATGQAYSILITATDVRLQHIDDRGHYHYRHFGSEKPAKTARDRGERRDPERVKERWHVLDNASADHVFARISPKHVTIYHRDGVWRVLRIAGRVIDLNGSDGTTHSSKQPRRIGGKLLGRDSTIKRFDLYSVERRSDESRGGCDEPILCANTPGERDVGGAPPRAYQSYYHNL